MTEEMEFGRVRSPRQSEHERSTLNLEQVADDGAEER